MLPTLARAALAAGLALTTAGAAGGQLLRLYYPDIEQGSSTLVVSPTGRALLVDAGTGIRPADDDVALFLRDLQAAGVVTSLDTVIATHYDEDHIGRLEDVLNFGGVSPAAVAYDRGDYGGTPGTFAFYDYLDAAQRHGRTTMSPFLDFDLGGGVTVECYVVNGELRGGGGVDITGSGQFENSASIAVVVRYGDFDAWIGGDLTGNPAQGVSDVETPVAALVGDLDLYTVNHHGSRTSSNATFLATLKAEVAINQNSVTNDYGHPNTEVVNRFLATLDSSGRVPLFFQQNPGNPTDSRSDDSLAAGIADPDDVTDVVGLPGTLLVLSDGASYQISGGNIGPLALPADTGPGTIGDFPPAILTVRRTPLVPAAGVAVRVEATVADEGAVSVELLHSVDGVEQAPLPMAPAGGSTYAADLPPRSDGALLAFRVRATDGGGRASLSPAASFYAGVTPIGLLRGTDANGVLWATRSDARVRGHLTAEPGLFHPYVTQAYVQDATGGVEVFAGSLLALGRGDEVEFVGRIEQFSGLAEVNVGQPFGNYGFTLVGPGTPPEPAVVTAAAVAEPLEGTLIRINSVEVVAGAIPESGDGTLTVSDDGGLTTVTVFVDGDTDLPGAETPTQPFDLIGIAAQFDTRFPFVDGYEIVPRGRADVLSAEVNLPPLLINEIHADPQAGGGDANGDGVVGSTDDEFVELVNTTYVPLDVSGWSLSDGLRQRHVFAPGTVVPAREAIVVFGGGVPTGAFGNAAANGLVFVASTGTLSLNNDGDTVSLLDASGAIVQAVTWGAEGGSDQSLVRQPDATNTALVLHTLAAGSGGRRFSPGIRVDGVPFTVAPGTVLLTEVMYDPSGADDGLEWVELYNASARVVDLAEMSLGSGGGDYTTSRAQLSGLLNPGATFVVGGPTASPDNGNPRFDLVLDFSPDLQNSGTDAADGVALFNLRASRVGAATVPVDAVVYGPNNASGLIDETGVANPPEVGDAPSGASIGRVDLGGAWQIQTAPDPNVFLPGGPPPPPASGLLVSEVMYDPSSTDDGFEWVELYNSGAAAIDLAGFSLGNGGADYTYSRVQLAGSVAPGATFVVGGPGSDATNGGPLYDQVANFSPDFQNSGAAADGVALFAVPAAQVTASTVPIDAVVYGPVNSSGLIDETGVAGSPEVGDAPAGSSIERADLAGSWVIQASPTPNASPLSGGDVTPPAAPAGLVATAGDAAVDLDWLDNPEADLGGYHVYRSTTAGGGHVRVTAAPLPTSGYADSGLTNGTTYYYLATAVDGAGNESPPSPEVAATPQALPGAAHVATILLATSGGAKKKGQARVTVVDAGGAPVAGATVRGTFTGSYAETRSGVTAADGTALVETAGRARDPIQFSFCVDAVNHPTLAYDAGANLETCDSF